MVITLFTKLSQYLTIQTYSRGMGIYYYKSLNVLEESIDFITIATEKPTTATTVKYQDSGILTTKRAWQSTSVPDQQIKFLNRSKFKC